MAALCPLPLFKLSQPPPQPYEGKDTSSVLFVWTKHLGALQGPSWAVQPSADDGDMDAFMNCPITHVTPLTPFSHISLGLHLEKGTLVTGNLSNRLVTSKAGLAWKQDTVQT